MRVDAWTVRRDKSKWPLLRGYWTWGKVAVSGGDWNGTDNIHLTI